MLNQGKKSDVWKWDNIRPLGSESFIRFSWLRNIQFNCIQCCFDTICFYLFINIFFSFLMIFFHFFLCFLHCYRLINPFCHSKNITKKMFWFANGKHFVCNTLWFKFNESPLLLIADLNAVEIRRANSSTRIQNKQKNKKTKKRKKKNNKLFHSRDRKQKLFYMRRRLRLCNGILFQSQDDENVRIILLSDGIEKS